MGAKIDISDRLKKLPPYLFVEIDREKRQKIEEGRDIIDLGIGDPDQPTPDFIIKALNEAVKDPSTHHYALDSGMMEFRVAIAQWYKKRFGVLLDPEAEILPLIGSKDGIAHIPFAFLNTGDVVLSPNPGYPPYRNAAIIAGGDVYDMPLLEENSFLPKLDSIGKEVLSKAKLMFLNYPNNPTGAVCDKAFYKKAVDFATKNNIILCSDAAYTELSYDGYIPSSVLEIEGAKDIAVEFHSLSKTFNMTGWRIGMACGNRDVIKGLAKVKSNVDSGIFNAIQRAGIVALDRTNEVTDKFKKIYQERRDILVDGLRSIGWEVEKPKATFYIWAKNLSKRDSTSMSKLILNEADIVVTPGSGFGKYGEGYVRMALTVPRERLKVAVDRIKKII
ncbi:MAG: LL-diaminopimelate aminotransferase [Candidatus Omnitrophota bacterium]